MNLKFREFVNKKLKKDKIWSESLGRSYAQITPVITQPMANLLSLVYGTGLKERALEWLLTEGLQQASKGRTELAAKVNQIIEGKSSGVVKMPRPIQNIQPTKKIAGIGEARNIYVPGEDKFDQESHKMVTPLDLFSPEAYQRIPALANILIDGKTITEYYNEHYEPKEMSLMEHPGSHIEINLEELNHVLRAYGLTPFKYGGFDGYMQYIEKGDYLPEEQRRSFTSVNDQHGPDLRIDKEAKTYDPSGRPVYNFVGGGIAPEGKRVARAIRKMSNNFVRTMNKIKTGGPIDDMDPNEVKIFKELLLTNQNMKETQVDAIQKGIGRGRPAKQLFNMDASDETVADIPAGLDEDGLNMFLALIRRGLELPFSGRDLDSWGSPEEIWSNWDGEGQQPEGTYHYDDKNGMSFRLSKEQQEEIINHIVAPIADNQLNFKFQLNKFKTLSNGNASKNIKLSLSTLFNNAIKSNPEFKDKFKRVFYSLKDRKEGGVDPRTYMSKMDIKKLEVDPLKPFDPYLSKLEDKGYRWEKNQSLISDPRDINDWRNKGIGHLRNYNSVYRVEFDHESKKFYLLVPVKKADGRESFDPPTYGKGGESWLKGGIDVAGGIGTGHMDINPASERNYEKLITLLKLGWFGEPDVGAQNELELKCVQDGVKAGVGSFKSENYTLPPGHDYEEFLAHGVDALRAFAGDRAFQIGYVTRDELEKILKFDLEKQQRAEEEHGKGMGIQVQMQRQGITDPDAQEEYLNRILTKLETSSIINLAEIDPPLPPEFIKALGENAYKARVRTISFYVQKKLNQIKSEENKQGRLRFGAGADDSGKGGVGSDITQKHSISSKDKIGNWSDEIKHVSSTDLLGTGSMPSQSSNQTTFGATASKPNVAPKPVSTPTTPATPRPAPTPKAPVSGLKKAWGNWDDEASAKPSQKQVQKAPMPKVPVQRTPVQKAPVSSLRQTWGDWDDEVPVPVQKAPVSSLRQAWGDWDDEVPVPVQKAPVSSLRQAWGDWDESMSWIDWFKKKYLQETSVVFDSKQKPKNGCGWNYEGAPGKVATSISGEADTAKTDPVGKKGSKRGRKDN